MVAEVALMLEGLGGGGRVGVTGPLGGGGRVGGTGHLGGGGRVGVTGPL